MLIVNALNSRSSPSLFSSVLGKWSVNIPGAFSYTSIQSFFSDRKKILAYSFRHYISELCYIHKVCLGLQGYSLLFRIGQQYHTGRSLSPRTTTDQMTIGAACPPLFTMHSLVHCIVAVPGTPPHCSAVPCKWIGLSWNTRHRSYKMYRNLPGKQRRWVLLPLYLAEWWFYQESDPT